MEELTKATLMKNVKIGEPPIILNGPPSNLEGHILLRNDNKERIKIRALELQTDNRKKGNQYLQSNIYIGSRLDGGTERLETINTSVAPHTPPGEYNTTLSIGNQKKDVKIVVQPNIAVAIHPKHFTFQNTAPNTLHSAKITVTNVGNVEFQIPDIRHVAAVDLDSICRALGSAIRNNKNTGITAVLDQASQSYKDHLPDWCTAKIKEKGKIIQPTESLLIHLQIRLAKNTDAKSDYSITARFWDQDLRFDVKSHSSAKKVSKPKT